MLAKMTRGHVLTRDPAGGVQALFAGRRVGYSFNTRVAIRRAYDLLGLRPGDEVLAPAYNCGSELDPLLHAGVTIRLYPVDRTAQIDCGAVERMIGPRTKAIYLTHYFGFLQRDAAALRLICDQHGLFLIEDCALSLLSGARPAEGRFGDVAVFCFYKFFPVIGGGALVVNNPALSGAAPFHRPAPLNQVGRAVLRETLQKLPGSDALFGALKRHRRQSVTAAPVLDAPDMPPHYYFDPRLRDRRISRLTAWTLQSFAIDATIRARRRNYLRLQDCLAGVAGVTLLADGLPQDACPMGMPVLVTNRNAVADRLTRQGISVTPWWAGFHRRLSWEGCADACHLKNHLLMLPVYQGLDDGAMDRIAQGLAMTIGR